MCGVILEERKMPAPWKKEGEASILANRWGKKLIIQQFVNPKTGKGEDYVQFAQKDWAVVLPITKDKKVIVVTEYKQGRDCVADELPAGTADYDDEPPEQVMARELKEETGYEAGQMISLGYGWMSTRNSPTKFYCFVAFDCEKVGPAKLDENEDIEWRLVDWEVWLKMVMDGSITEPSAVMATVRALPHLKKKIV